MHGIPDEFAGAGERKIPHIFSFKYPCFLARWFCGFIFFCLLGGDDEYGCFRACCLLKSRPLLVRQYFLAILKLTRCGHDMIVRHRNGNAIISKFEREFSATKKLFVMPATIVGVGSHAWKPLGHFINEIIIFGEILITAAGTNQLGIDDVIGPGNGKMHRFAGFQRKRQINAHHGFDDGMAQVSSRSILDGMNACLAIKRFTLEQSSK